MPNVSPSDPWLMPLLAVELLVCTAVIIYIDFRYMIIPDAINLALLTGGIVLWAPEGFTAIGVACLTGAAVFGFVWLLRRIHSRATGRIGLGMGDVKLIGVAAIWLPFAVFPAFLFSASFLALVFAITTVGSRARLHRRIPFGPFLACSLVVTWAFQHHIISLLGLS
ncbi:prepilin peptidase [Rhizobium sp.]|uniref:prepilin peptidase n=1 Tax=Rhizobium sp. TaxID=391 RepID=UPI00289A052B